MQLHSFLTNCLQTLLLNQLHAFIIPTFIETKDYFSDFIIGQTNSHLSIIIFFNLSWHLLNLCLLGKHPPLYTSLKFVFSFFFLNLFCSL